MKALAHIEGLEPLFVFLIVDSKTSYPMHTDLERDRIDIPLITL